MCSEPEAGGSGDKAALGEYMSPDSVLGEVDRLKGILRLENHAWTWDSQSDDYLLPNSDKTPLKNEENVTKVTENSLPAQIRSAVLLVSQVDENSQYELVSLVSNYVNASVPWSNDAAATEAQKVVDFCVPHMDRFFSELRPNLLALPASKVSLNGYPRTQVRTGLRPALGLSGSAGDEEKRAEWKTNNVATLSSVILVILAGLQWSGFGQVWPSITTFILNVLDDSDPVFRRQGCLLLAAFAQRNLHRLVQSGLDKVFLESVEVCLTYLPNLTPAHTSLQLLEVAYPVLLQLLEAQYAPYTRYLDVVEKNVLALVSHVLGRTTDPQITALLVFLINEFCLIVTTHVRESVLACFSRINFVLSLILVNPYLVESQYGWDVVDAALNAHAAILDIFTNLNDPKAAQLLLLHRHDLLAAWSVLMKRVNKYGVGSTQTGLLVTENVSRLQKIAAICGETENLLLDLQAIESVSNIQLV